MKENILRTEIKKLSLFEQLQLGTLFVMLRLKLKSLSIHLQP